MARAKKKSKLKHNAKVKRMNYLLEQQIKQKVGLYECLFAQTSSLRERFAILQETLPENDLNLLHKMLANKTIKWMVFNEYFEKSLVESLEDIGLLFDQIAQNHSLALFIKAEIDPNK